MRTRPARVLSTLGLGLAGALLAGCGGGGGSAGGSSSDGGSGGSEGSEGSGSQASGSGDKALCGEPVQQWTLGLRDALRADPADEAAYGAALDEAAQDTEALAGRAEDADLEAALEKVATDIGDLEAQVSSGAVDMSDPAAKVRAGADALAGQADVAQACLDLGAA